MTRTFYNYLGRGGGLAVSGLHSTPIIIRVRIPMTTTVFISYKSAKIFSENFGYFKKHQFLRNNCFGYFLATFGNYFGFLYSNLWSHCLGIQKREIKAKQREREREKIDIKVRPKLD